jgi:hypothetical protein
MPLKETGPEAVKDAIKSTISGLRAELAVDLS